MFDVSTSYWNDHNHDVAIQLLQRVQFQCPEYADDKRAVAVGTVHRIQIQTFRWPILCFKLMLN